MNPQANSSTQSQAGAASSYQVGAGKAQQAVAQSVSLLVQDAVDIQRNLSVVSSTAIGVAISQYLATTNKDYLDAIDTAQNVLSCVSNNFEKIGVAAAKTLQAFTDQTDASGGGLAGQTNGPGSHASPPNL